MKLEYFLPAVLLSIYALLLPATTIAASTIAYINGNIYTSDTDQRFVSTVVIEDGRFTYVGNNTRKVVGKKGIEVVDLKGKTVVPGLYDSHIHPIGAGEKHLFKCNFSNVAQVPEILAAVKACVARAPAGTWIQGGSWGAHILNPKDMPGIKDLDAVSGDHPVALIDFSNHNIWANSKALQEAGVSSKNVTRYGKLVVRDKAGRLTGILMESASSLVRDKIPTRTNSEYQMAARYAVKELNRMGIVGVKDSYVFDNEYNTWKALDDKGELTLNVALSWGWPSDSTLSLEEKARQFEAMVKPDSGHLYSHFAKITLDGIPPTKTAAMLAPYLPESEGVKGELMIPENTLAEALGYLDRQGYTTQIHAVGDNAARTVLNAVETVRSQRGDSGLRHEIAHACIIDPQDIPRLSQLKVVPNFSPVFWYPSPIQDGLVMVIGHERAGRNCAVKTLVENGAMPTAGSDWPVSDYLSPWKAMESLVTRKDPDGQRPDEALWPEQRVTIEQALQLYTINGARALRIDSKAGSIEVGKSADMLILNQNIFDIDAAAIGETVVEKTLFEGSVVHEDPIASVTEAVEQYASATFTADVAAMRRLFHLKAINYWKDIYL